MQGGRDSLLLFLQLFVLCLTGLPWCHGSLNAVGKYGGVCRAVEGCADQVAIDGVDGDAILGMEEVGRECSDGLKERRQEFVVGLAGVDED